MLFSYNLLNNEHSWVFKNLTATSVFASYMNILPNQINWVVQLVKSLLEKKSLTIISYIKCWNKIFCCKVHAKICHSAPREAHISPGWPKGASCHPDWPMTLRALLKDQLEAYFRHLGVVLMWCMNGQASPWEHSPIVHILQNVTKCLSNFDVEFRPLTLIISHAKSVKSILSCSRKCLISLLPCTLY